MLADLHTHSTASDGQYSPSELARLVKARGAEAWALTDHDTIGGLAEAVRTGEALGLRVICGVELSADDYLNLHILGYGFPVDAPPLQKMLQHLQKGRSDRKYRIQNYLRKYGVEVPLEEVEAEAKGGVIGRPHFAQAMARLGIVASRREAFDRYLDTPDFQEMENGRKPSAQRCVETIKAAGGKASLAHPYQIVLGGDRLEDLVERLIGYGLDAVECCYPQHTEEQRAEYLSLARRYGLHVTGGSDFHGEKNKPDNPLAAWELDIDWLI